MLEFGLGLHAVPWLEDIIIMHEMKWTREQLDSHSPLDLARLRAYLGAKNAVETRKIKQANKSSQPTPRNVISP